MENAAPRTMELVINSRPDVNGIVWFLLRDPGLNDPDVWGGAIARYFTANNTFPRVVTECGNAFVGVDANALNFGDAEPQPVTSIVRRVSEFFAGHPLQARFTNATHEAINAGNSSPDVVGPVLYFRINRTSPSTR